MKKKSEAEKLVFHAERILKKNEVATDSKWFWDYLKSYKKICTTQIENCLKLKRNFSKNNPSIIDIGSAPFLLPMSLKSSKHFSRVACVDINPYKFKNIDKLELDFYQLDLDYPSFEVINEKFDIVYFSHVLEHLRINLITSMRLLSSILEEGGIIYVETPNSFSLIGWYNKLFKGISTSCCNDLFQEWQKLEKLGFMGHVREYSLNELFIFFEKLNYKVLEKGYCGTYSNDNIRRTLIKILQILFPSFKNNIYFVLQKNL